jgi:hypothetical protein
MLPVVLGYVSRIAGWAGWGSVLIYGGLLLRGIGSARRQLPLEPHRSPRLPV